MIVVAIGGAFALSCQIQARMTPPPDGAHASAGAALLGESRLGLSSYFHEMADLYFHCGVEHTRHEAIHGTWFQQRLAALRPSLHKHTDRQASREIVAWLRLATAMNPHDVDMVLLAAFWLHHEVGERELAQQMLKDAQVANPFDYEIQMERGRLYLYDGDVSAARGRFDAALAFWPGALLPDDDTTRHDRARLLLYRSLIHEVEGERSEAVAGLREILLLFPERTHLRNRIATLESGAEPALLGHRVWNNLLQSEDERSMLCETDADHPEDAHVHSEDCHH
jgi:tetratricopeptide (TPR) repeat protein